MAVVSSPPARPRRPTKWIIAAGCALAIVVVGAFLVIKLVNGGGSGHQVPQLKALLDRVPVPSGATLVGEKSYEANGDSSAYADRTYRLAATPTPSEQVFRALSGSSVLVVGSDGHAAAVTSQSWSAQVSPTAGDVYVLPSGTTGGGIEVNWNGDRLNLSVQPGDVHDG